MFIAAVRTVERLYFEREHIEDGVEAARKAL